MSGEKGLEWLPKSKFDLIVKGKHFDFYEVMEYFKDKEIKVLKC
jgi:hypothetical protein